MTKLEKLKQALEMELSEQTVALVVAHEEITLECTVENLLSVLTHLRKKSSFKFDQLIDICGVDYLRYGKYDWETESATEHGFSRAVEFDEAQASHHSGLRFAVVYHLLSTTKNQRIRVRVYVSEDNLVVPSVHALWVVANWFEREAYDLYGILFEGHPDLRRILTDYGFIGYPFRKDFPLSGHVEMRYDAQLQKVIYEPVDIQPRVTVPKVIRTDNRYHDLPEAAP